MSNKQGKARNARINQARQHASELLDCLARLSAISSDIYIDQKDDWQDGRNMLEQLVQCFHEANAYNNSVKK